MTDTESPSGQGGRRRRRRDLDGSDGLRGKVRPHDPFELIRWLALSQPDPRKALAELVQNSLDAGAGLVRIVRVREHGTPTLKIWDDGAGVIPEMERPAALQFLATHIGHSRKRDLSPQQRLQLMTQGQYGIGLLGFWSLGERLEIRSSLPGQPSHRLVLYRDRPQYLVERLRGRLRLEERFTEVVVSGLHAEAQSALVGRRAADFLSAELRGQLLSREVRLVIEDRMSRGRAPKRIEVRPLRFLGERILALSSLAVPGHASVRLEVHVTAGDTPAPLAVYAAGTLAAPSFRDLGALGLDRAPWTDPRLTGLVDFPDLTIAPGSRRGIVVDEAAAAFGRALLEVEPVLIRALEEGERRRAEQLDRTLVRDLQRAFRDFARHRPRWAMLPVEGPADRAVAESGAGAPTGHPPEHTGEGAEASAPEPGQGPEGTSPLVVGTGHVRDGEDSGVEALEHGIDDLLPSGPLVALRLLPSALRLPTGTRRRIRALPLDAAGRRVLAPCTYAWRAFGAIGTVEPGSPTADVAILTAADAPGEGALEVEARSLEHGEPQVARAEAAVEVTDPALAGSGVEGIPSPELVDHPGAPWRSRVQGDRWQVNTGHADWRAVRDRPTLKLRYMASLLAKELVLRNSQDPRLEAPLEHMIEVVAFADQRLALSRSARAGTRRKDPASAHEDGTG